ncbi:hypothetical protein ACTU6U_12525 [Microbacterium sp. A196]|uniref:hypothetical protein n=1 Tax=Microbacterium sp. A196 TaxID=3457320 RepID=UPI003FCF79E7
MSTDTPEELFSDEDGVLYAEQVTPQPGILRFTLRELLIVAAWLVLFIVSFIPVGWGPALWLQGISWIIPLGLPTVAVFLIVLRRFSPDGIRRVGSLGIDQFASVVFSIAALWWVQVIWEFVSVSVLNGSYGVIWVPWVQLAALIMLVIVTVFAPIIPGLREDFHGRLVALAHRNANPVRPVIARPRPERTAQRTAAGAAIADGVELDAEIADSFDEESVDEITHETVEQQNLGGSVPLTEHASGGAIGTAMDLDDDYVPTYRRSSNETLFIEEDPVVEDDLVVEAENSQPQPFWALAPTARDVVDEQGAPLFRIGPDAWALVVEDRGGAYVIRHDDGRIGYLHEIADITKG